MPDEIEEFLRRAAMRRMRKAQEAQEAQQAQQPPSPRPQPRPPGFPPQQGFGQQAFPQAGQPQQPGFPPQRPGQSMPMGQPMAAGRPDIEIIEPDVVEGELVEAPLGAALTEHITHYLDEREFEQRASELGEEVGLADDILEERLRREFGHKVGRLPGGPVAEAKAAPLGEGAVVALPPDAGTAAVLVGMIRSRQGLRAAIVLSEIIERPEHRW